MIFNRTRKMFLGFVQIFILIEAQAQIGTKPIENHNASVSANYSKIRQRLDQKGDAETVMVIAHRADWRNAPENSLQAIQNCIDMGVDAVELDIRETKDGRLVLMHDSKIDRTTSGKGNITSWKFDSLRNLVLRNGVRARTMHKVPSLEEALILAKKQILVQLDVKCEFCIDRIMDLVTKLNVADQCIVPAKESWPLTQKYYGEAASKLIFIHNLAQSYEDSDEYSSGYEPSFTAMKFKDEKAKTLKRIEKIRSMNRVWGSTYDSRKCAGHSDDRSIKDGNLGWGWMIERGFNVLVTDRPQMLINYLNQGGLR